MFSANISGQIKRIIHDNGDDGKDAMLKIVVETRKQFAKKDDMPNVYPLVTIWGHDAAYVREYAGVGHWIEVLNCDLDVYRPDDADEDRLSFKAGKINLLPKVLSEAISDVLPDEEEDDDDRGRKKKKTSSRGSSSKSSKGKSRSERRGKSRDEDEEEEEAPRRKKKTTSERKGKASDGAKKKTSSSSRKKKEEDYDEDYDDDYEDDDYDDDDDYFDDED